MLIISLRSKNVLFSEKIIICPNKILLFSKKIITFPEKFCYFRKKIICREKIMTCPKSSRPPPPPPAANISVKMFLGALFFRKVPLETAPPPTF